jgi:hypothetical protein
MLIPAKATSPRIKEGTLFDRFVQFDVGAVRATPISAFAWGDFRAGCVTARTEERGERRARALCARRSRSVDDLAPCLLSGRPALPQSLPASVITNNMKGLATRRERS